MGLFLNRVVEASAPTVHGCVLLENNNRVPAISAMNIFLSCRLESFQTYRGLVGPEASTTAGLSVPYLSARRISQCSAGFFQVKIR